MPKSTGCALSGFVLVKKVPGTLHFLPRASGHSFDFHAINMSHQVGYMYYGNKPSPRRRQVRHAVQRHIDSCLQHQTICAAMVCLLQFCVAIRVGFACLRLTCTASCDSCLPQEYPVLVRLEDVESHITRPHCHAFCEATTASSVICTFVRSFVRSFVHSLKTHAR